MLLYSLFLKGRGRVWKSVAFKALVLTCADSYQEETIESMETDEMNDHSYQEYITLWTGLLRPMTDCEDPEEQTAAFMEEVYEMTLQASMQLIKNLDLSIDQNSLDLSSAKASNPKDYAIFLNLVCTLASLILVRQSSLSNTSLSSQPNIFSACLRKSVPFGSLKLHNSVIVLDSTNSCRLRWKLPAKLGSLIMSFCPMCIINLDRLILYF
jgi:hypothetical protein